jgi:predicted amidohydrolase
MMRAHLVQADTVWEDRPANYALVDAMLAGAGVAPGDLVLLPEMFDTGFSFRLDRTADTDGATLAYLQSLARRLGAVVQGSRTLIGPDGRGRNRASIIGPDGVVLAEYDKIHPFSFGRETEFFSGGNEVMTYAWGPTRVCPAICYDLRFPEQFRQGMLMGAEVFALGANWPEPRKLHRRALGVARAIENQAVMLCVNRAGRDPHLAYEGGSYAVDPQGQIIAELGAEAGVLSVEIDLPALRAWREKFPAWKDARLLGPGR